MKYKGIELKEITEPQLFNPPKPMLAWDSDDGDHPCELNVCAIVNRDGFRVITERSAWKHCAEIPESSPVTNRELTRWLSKGNGEVKDEGCVYTNWFYWTDRENESIKKTLLVRKWDDTEWHKPTREYLGLEDK